VIYSGRFPETKRALALGIAGEQFDRLDKKEFLLEIHSIPSCPQLVLGHHTRGDTLDLVRYGVRYFRILHTSTLNLSLSSPEWPANTELGILIQDAID